MKSTACVLFNHPFSKNIPILREVYRERFDDVIFVQPLEKSNDVDVFTSYRGPFCFHGMIVDVARTLLEKRSDYYLFIHDDVFLNPLYDAENLFECLGIPGNGAFIPAVCPIEGDVTSWGWTSSVLWKLFYPKNKLSGSGIERPLQFFPDGNKMREEIMKKYQFKFSDVTYDRNVALPESIIFGQNPYSITTERMILDGLFEKAKNSNSTSLPFPFFRGMSDFFAVDAETLEKIIPLLGVMAAAQLFVEVAIPTALIVAANRVKRSIEVGLKVDWRWGTERDALDFESMAMRFHEDLLFVHPVKLSKNQEQMMNIIAQFRSKTRKDAKFNGDMESLAKVEPIL